METGHSSEVWLKTEEKLAITFGGRTWQIDENYSQTNPENPIQRDAVSVVKFHHPGRKVRENGFAQGPPTKTKKDTKPRY